MNTKHLLRPLALAGLAGMLAAAPVVAADYDAPNHDLAPELQYNVDLAYLLMGGKVAPGRLATLLTEGHILPPGKTPLQAESENKRTLPPFKPFDQLTYLGMNTVGAWAVKTSAGIILFDTLDNTEEAQRIIEGGMKTAGLNPADIKYIVITHAHGDHFGGAKYLQDKYHPHILMSPADWAVMERGAAQPPRAGRTPLPIPAHDMDVVDGQKLTLGDMTLNLYITPGHTPGTVSAIIPVTDHGQHHALAFFGGTGFPQTIEATPSSGGLKEYQAQIFRFAKLCIDKGVDGIIANHPVADGTVEKSDQVMKRKAGAPNPYVVGQDMVLRYYGATLAALHASIVYREAHPPEQAAGAQRAPN
jgi:metallo-beta-lactamase class B